MSEQRPVLSSSPAQRLARWVDARRHWVFACIALIYIIAWNGQWRINPDSALYCEIGRNLAEGAGYTYHGQHHSLAYPLLPWLLGLVWSVTGVSFVAATVLMLGLHFLALVLFY